MAPPAGDDQVLATGPRGIRRARGPFAVLSTFPKRRPQPALPVPSHFPPRSYPQTRGSSVVPGFRWGLTDLPQRDGNADHVSEAWGEFLAWVQPPGVGAPEGNKRRRPLAG